MFGERSAVDADAGAVRHLNEFGEELLELGRPRALDLVSTLGDEKVGVLKRRYRDGLFAIKERKGERAGDGFAGGLIAYEREGYH